MMALRGYLRLLHQVGQRAGKLVRASLLSLATVLAIAGSMNPAMAQAPVLSMSFGAPTIGVGDTTTLSFRINNNSPRVARLVAFGNSLPAGLVVAAPPRVINSCGGVVSADAGSGLFQVSGVAMRPRSSCTVSVNVTATSAGVKYNMTTRGNIHCCERKRRIDGNQGIRPEHVSGVDQPDRWHDAGRHTGDHHRHKFGRRDCSHDRRRCGEQASRSSMPIPSPPSRRPMMPARSMLWSGRRAERRRGGRSTAMTRSFRRWSSVVRSWRVLRSA